MVLGPTESGGAGMDGALAIRAAFGGALCAAAGAGEGARTGLGGGSGGAAGARSGRMPANWTNALCNFGVISLGAP